MKKIIYKGCEIVPCYDGGWLTIFEDRGIPYQKWLFADSLDELKEKVDNVMKLIYE